MIRARHLFLAALCTGIAFSQDEQADPLPPGALPDQVEQADERPPGIPAPIIPADSDIAPEAGGDPQETLIVEDIVEPKLNGATLAALYRQYTGRRVIVSSGAAQAELSFVQDASPERPLSYAEAADLLRKAAVIEGFVFVPDATNPNLDILVNAAAGMKPGQRGIDVYTENDDLPESDAVISYVMTFDHIKPENALNAFNQIVGQLGSYGSIAAVPNAAAVVITENTSLIRKLIDLKMEIDKPSSQVATRFIKVQYADVTELAEVLNELLNAQQQAQTTAGIQRTGQAAQPPGTEGGGEGGSAGASGEATPVQIIAEPRTSRIFAMGRPADLLFVEGLVAEFDRETDNRTFMRRKLKFLTVSEFLPVAENALARAFTGTTEGASSSQGSAGGQSRNPRAQTSNRMDGQSSGFSSSQSGVGGTGGATRGDALGDPTITTAPDSMVVGRTLLVADNITNSVIVQGPPSGIEIIERLLDQLDVKADQVMISTVFGQLTLSDGISSGVDYLVQSGDLAGRGGGGLLDNFLPIVPIGGDDIYNPGSIATGSGLQLYGRIGDLSVYLRALQSKSNFTILSRPSIFTANNQKGTISSGRRIAVPTNSNSFSAGGVSTNIEYRDVVLKLEVIPLVNSNDEITLQIALVSDDVIGQSDPIEGIGSVPIIGTREILTTVTVPNNQTVILGGLITTNNKKSKSGIPILSSIPGLGRLFSTVEDSASRDELLVFIQPSIVNSDATLDALQVDTDVRYDVSEQARRFADGPNLPPLSREVEIIEEKGRVTPRRTVITPHEPSHPSERRSLRPVHRR